MTSSTRRSTAAVAGLLAVAALIPVSASAVGGTADSGVAYVAITHVVGSGSSGTSYVAGDSKDKLFGAGAVTYSLHLLPSNTQGTISVTAPKVTEFFSNGSLTGTGSAKVTVGAGGHATVSNGKLRLTKGTGGQKGHTFIGTFSGTGSVVSGSYKFIYSGTYK